MSSTALWVGVILIVAGFACLFARGYIRLFGCALILGGLWTCWHSRSGEPTRVETQPVPPQKADSTDASSPPIMSSKDGKVIIDLAAYLEQHPSMQAYILHMPEQFSQHGDWIVVSNQASHQVYPTIDELLVQEEARSQHEPGDVFELTYRGAPGYLLELTGAGIQVFTESLSGNGIAEAYRGDVLYLLSKNYEIKGRDQIIASAKRLSPVPDKTNVAQTGSQEDGHDAAFYMMRGLGRAQAGDLDAAIADLDTAIELDPGDWQAYDARSYLKQSKQDFDGAIVDSNRAIKLQPQQAPLYKTRAGAEEQKGDFGAAISDDTKAIELQPNYALAYLSRAVAKAESGDIDGAIADCTQLIRFDPDNASAYSTRATAKARKGDLDDAISDCTKATQLRPDYAFAYSTCATAKEIKGGTYGECPTAPKQLHWRNSISALPSVPFGDGLYSDTISFSLSLLPRVEGCISTDGYGR